MHSVIKCPDCGCTVTGQLCEECKWQRPVSKNHFKTISSVLRQEAAVYGKTMSEEAITGYQKYLSGYTPEEIERALEQLQTDEDSKRYASMPRPGEILSKLKSRTKQNSDSTAWYSQLDARQQDRWSVLQEAVITMMQGQKIYEQHERRLGFNLQRFDLTLDTAIQHYNTIVKKLGRCHCGFCNNLTEVKI